MQQYSDERTRLLEELFVRTTQGIKYDVERIRAAAERMGNPQRELQAVHVAGTNGKGSTCAMIASVLGCAGFRTGLYTSPHLTAFEERFLIDGRPVTTDQWIAVYRDCAPLVREFHLTFFEAATLIAFELFRRCRVDWGIFETGMGGRLDATNILIPRISVITAIDYDHCEYLGTTIEQIAAEKLGIIKAGVPVVMYRPSRSSVEALARERCAACDASLYLVGEQDCAINTTAGGCSGFTFEGHQYRLSLAGPFQVGNAVCALKACALLGFGEHVVLREGLARVRIPGRFQQFGHRGKKVILDVGHNRAGARALANAITSLYCAEDVCVVAGVMNDKDREGVLLELCGCCTHLVTCSPRTPRSSGDGELAALVPAGFRGKVLTGGSVEAALDVAFALPCTVVCITGSFFTVAQAMSALGIDPYR